MRGVSKRFRRSAVLLALLYVFATQAVLAADGDRGRTPGDRLDCVKRFVITVFSRIGLPPG